MGFGHTLARGMKAGAVIDLAEAEQAVRQALDLAERYRHRAAEVGRGLAFGRQAGKRAHRPRPSTWRAARVRRRYRPRAHCRQPAFGAPAAVPCCIRCRSAIRSTMPPASAIRAACSGRRFGVDMHAMTADIAVARNLILAIERCHLEVEALVASPYVAGLAVLADDEADLGRRPGRHGRRHHHHGGVLRRPLRSWRWLCGRRPSRDDGYRARINTRIADVRANQDALWQRAGGGFGRA